MRSLILIAVAILYTSPLAASQEYASGCISAVTVQTDDTCSTIADRASITLTQLLHINPNLDCGSLSNNSILCISAPCLGVTANPKIFLPNSVIITSKFHAEPTTTPILACPKTTTSSASSPTDLSTNPSTLIVTSTASPNPLPTSTNESQTSQSISTSVAIIGALSFGLLLAVAAFLVLFFNRRRRSKIFDIETIAINPPQPPPVPPTTATVYFTSTTMAPLEKPPVIGRQQDDRMSFGTKYAGNASGALKG